MWKYREKKLAYLSSFMTHLNRIEQPHHLYSARSTNYLECEPRITVNKKLQALRNRNSCSTEMPRNIRPPGREQHGRAGEVDLEIPNSSLREQFTHGGCVSGDEPSDDLKGLKLTQQGI